SLPFEPELTRMVGVQVVLDLETHVSGEVLGTFSYQQMMIGLVHHRPRRQGRRAHAFKSGHSAGSFLWSMHAGGVELNNTFGVGQAAVAHRILQWVEFEYVDTSNQRVEHIR